MTTSAPPAGDLPGLPSTVDVKLWESISPQTANRHSAVFTLTSAGHKTDWEANSDYYTANEKRIVNARN